MRQVIRFATVVLTSFFHVSLSQVGSSDKVPQSNLDGVRHAYEVFAQGDVPAFLGLLDAQVLWVEPEGVPGIGGTHIGPDAVLNDVLIPLTTEWESLTISPEEFFDAGDTVVMLGTVTATHSATRKALRSPNTAVWTFREGKVAKFQSFVNTAAFVEASTAAPSQGKVQSSEAGLRDLEMTWQNVQNRGQPEAVADLFTEDGWFSPFDGATIKGRDALRAFFAGADGLSIEIFPEAHTAVGELAYGHGSYTLWAPDGYQLVMGNYLGTYKRVDGEWRIHRYMGNAVMTAVQEAVPVQEALGDGIAERFVAIFNERDASIADDIFAPDFVAYVTGSPTPTLDREGWKAYVEAFRASFPDLRLEVQDVVTTGDKVILRVVLRGTQTGAFQDLPPSGNEVAFDGVAIHRTENGQVIEHWGVMDLLSLMQQLTAEASSDKPTEGGLAEDGEFLTALEASNLQFVTAFNEGNAAGVAARYAENAQLLPPNGGHVVGRAAIQAFWQGVMDSGVTTLQLETTELSGAGAGAYESGTYTLPGADQEVLDKGKYIVVWQRVAGEWKMYRDIWNSSLPQPIPGEGAEALRNQ